MGGRDGRHRHRQGRGGDRQESMRGGHRNRHGHGHGRRGGYGQGQGRGDGFHPSDHRDDSPYCIRSPYSEMTPSTTLDRYRSRQDRRNIQHKQGPRHGQDRQSRRTKSHSLIEQPSHQKNSPEEIRLEFGPTNDSIYVDIQGCVEYINHSTETDHVFAAQEKTDAKGDVLIYCRTCNDQAKESDGAYNKTQNEYKGCPLHKSSEAMGDCKYYLLMCTTCDKDHSIGVDIVVEGWMELIGKFVDMDRICMLQFNPDDDDAVDHMIQLGSRRGVDEEEAVSVQYQIAGEIRENHVARMWRDVLDLDITG